MTARATRRLLLIGAGYTGQRVAEALARTGHAEVLVAALDDDPARLGQAVGPVTVVGPISALHEVAQEHRPDEVLVAIPSLQGGRLRDIALACRAIGLPVRTMPGIVDLLGQAITPRQLRPVELADLLRRTTARCDDRPPDYLHGRRVLVTGGGGSIGRELARQICAASPSALVLLGHGENSIHAAHADLSSMPGAPPIVPLIADITDRRTLARAFATHRPDVVFHAAAHKHVPLMEAHPVEAVRNNVLGTAHVMRCAEDTGVDRVVFVSTDKAVAPAGVMGATKRIGEWIVHDAARRTGRPYVVVRFGNVLGSRGSVVPLLERQIARGGPLRLTHPEMTRFFMTVGEAVYLLLHAGAAHAAGGLYVLDMGAPVRIVDLAADLIALSGEDPAAIAVEFTGLRPGEKLAERLWEEDAVVTPTALRDVLLVREVLEPPQADALRQLLRGLGRAVVRGDDGRVRQLLGSALPSYVPAPAVAPA